MNSGEGWETMRRELSVLYSRFCKYSFGNQSVGRILSLGFIGNDLVLIKYSSMVLAFSYSFE
jgi:hypothetical protein